VEQGIGTSVRKSRQKENVHLDEDFMKSVTFDGAWKQGFVEKPAELGPLAEGRIRNPLPMTNDRDWWEYEFKVRSEGIGLNNALVIGMQSPDGKLVARLSARLGRYVVAIVRIYSASFSGRSKETLCLPRS